MSTGWVLQILYFGAKAPEKGNMLLNL